jgi:uncharacterized protein YcbK (DUF882 family)
MRRRELLTSAIGAAAYVLLPGRSYAAIRERRLALYNIHTAEKLDIEYEVGGSALRDACAEIDHFLRDFRTGEVHPIDVALLDQLTDLHRTCGGRGHFEVISGYRSPHTNELLRQTSTGVAKKSLHLVGRAIDVRLSGVPTAQLRAAALAAGRGGVGYYPKSDFVHLDTGRKRSW